MNRRTLLKAIIGAPAAVLLGKKVAEPESAIWGEPYTFQTFPVQPLATSWFPLNSTKVSYTRMYAESIADAHDRRLEQIIAEFKDIRDGKA